MAMNIGHQSIFQLNSYTLFLSLTVGTSLSMTKVNKFFINIAVNLGLNRWFTAYSSFYDFPFMNLRNCYNVNKSECTFSITEEDEGYESLGSEVPSWILLHKGFWKSCDPVVLTITYNSMHRTEQFVSQTFYL